MILVTDDLFYSVYIAKKKYDIEWILQKSNAFNIKVQCEENKTVLARDTIFCLHV